MNRTIREVLSQASKIRISSVLEIDRFTTCSVPGTPISAAERLTNVGESLRDSHHPKFKLENAREPCFICY